MTDPFYSTAEWLALRDRVRARDGGRCTVARLLGGACAGTVHVHHIEPRADRPDLELDDDNCASVCASHHPKWEAMRRFIERSRRELPPCGHQHIYASGRAECDRRRAKKLGIVLPAG
jgi:hypothetical protein